MPAYRVLLRPVPQLETRLVIANNPSQAMRFVSQGVMTCEAIGGQEVAELVQKGAEIEDARQAQHDLPLQEGNVAT